MAEGLHDLDDGARLAALRKILGDIDERILNGLIDSMHLQNSRIQGTKNILDATYASSFNTYETGGGKQKSTFSRR